VCDWLDLRFFEESPSERRGTTISSGYHEIREVAAAVVANPQPDLASIELAKLPNFDGDLVDAPPKI